MDGVGLQHDVNETADRSGQSGDGSESTDATSHVPSLPLCPDSRSSWLVLRTRARQEKQVAQFLTARHVLFYLPLTDRVNVIRGRKFRSRVPLFPGYVFMAGELDDAYAAISTKRVCQVLPVRDQVQLVSELSQVKRALEGDVPLELYPFAVVGQRCRVRRGPLMGMEGKITERLGPARLVLSVNMVGQGAALEIDADLLEPIDDVADDTGAGRRRPRYELSTAL